MNIIQLELKDLLFTLEKGDSKCESIEIANKVLFKRNGLDEFLIKLGKHFRIGIWTRFNEEITTELSYYITELGLNVVYCNNRMDCTQFGGHSDAKIEKRLKRLNSRGFIVSEIIILESEKPEHENYGNHFLISEFKGDFDMELKNCIGEIIKLELTEDTTRIN